MIHCVIKLGEFLICELYLSTAAFLEQSLNSSFFDVNLEFSPLHSPIQNLFKFLWQFQNMQFLSIAKTIYNNSF